jgi:flagellar export protein FliJ
MKKFVFTLETPLRVKRTREREAEGELGVAVMREREFRQERDGLTGRFQTATESLSRGLERGDVTLAELKVHSTGFTALRRRIAESDQKVEAAEGEVLRVTQKLKVLMRERRVLEEAREQQLAAWKSEAEREQTHIVDDFVSAQRAMAAIRAKHKGGENG